VSTSLAVLEGLIDGSGVAARIEVLLPVDVVVVHRNAFGDLEAPLGEDVFEPGAPCLGVGEGAVEIKEDSRRHFYC